MASLIEQYTGRTSPKPAQEKPYKYKPFKFAEAFTKQRVTYAGIKKRTDILIKDRNVFYAANKNIIKEPKYTFNEAMSLSNNGYTGLYGRSASKQTIGLMGQAWQQAYALDQLRKGKQMLSLGLYGDKKATLDYLAATPIVPGNKVYNNLAGLVGEFNDYGGEDKYVARYGTTPAMGTKYGILFNLNNKAVRKDDVLATYQNSLAKEMLNVSRVLTSPERNEMDKAIGVELD
jgi:hypothetical protein